MSIKSIPELIIIGSEILRHDPLPCVVIRLKLVLDDPIHRVTCLTPPSSGHQFTALNFFIHGIYELLLPLWAEAICLVNAAVNVVMTGAA